MHGIYNYDGKTLWAEVRVVNDTLLTGYRVTNGWARTNATYFAISFSQPMTEYGWTDRETPKYKGGYSKFPQYHNFPEMAGRKVVAWMKFNTREHPELTVKVALSATGTEGALKNLRARRPERVSRPSVPKRPLPGIRRFPSSKWTVLPTRRPCSIPPCITR